MAKKPKGQAGKEFEAVKRVVEGEVERGDTEPLDALTKEPRDANGGRSKEPGRKTTES